MKEHCGVENVKIDESLQIRVSDLVTLCVWVCVYVCGGVWGVFMFFYLL